MDAVFGAGSAVALEFNLICTVRLQKYDIQVAEARDESLAVKIANAVGKMFGGSSGDEVSADYGDSMAEVW